MERTEAVKIFLTGVKQAYIDDLRAKKKTASGKSEDIKEQLTPEGGKLIGVGYFAFLWNKKTPPGRKPSAKMPPIEAIMQWIIDKKTFKIEGDQTKGLRELAKAIARKIQKKGTDIYSGKSPAVNVDARIDELKKELVTNLTKSSTGKLQQSVSNIQNVES